MKKTIKVPSRSQAQIRRDQQKERSSQDALFKKRNSAANKRDAKYLADLRKLEKTGLYTPKGNRLTKYRKTQINKRAREYAEYLNPETFFFIPVAKGPRKKLLKYAKDFAIKATPIGIFIPHNGHTHATLRKSKSRRGEYEVVRYGKTKQGPNAGKVYTDIIPLEPFDTIAAEKGRLDRIGKTLGALKKGDRLSFRIVDHSGEGMSHNTYMQLDLLLAALERYMKDRSVGAGLYMLRHVIIEKTSVLEWRTEAEKKGLGSFNKRRKRKTKAQRQKGE